MMTNNSRTLHMLLLTADPSLVTTFTDVSGGLGIEAQSSRDCQQVTDQLNRAKYEGLVLDFDTVSNARAVLASLRQSRSNKNAVVFAIATNRGDAEHALQERAHFLLRRPIDGGAIRQTLDAAYDLMLGEHRTHFRYTASFPVSLVRMNTGARIECSSMNISSNGMAVMTPISFNLAEPLQVSLLLPDGFSVRATGIVIWDDKHGKSGLHFQCSTSEMRHRLNSWLDSQFATLHS